MRPVIVRLAVCWLVVLGWAGGATAQTSVLRGSQVYVIGSPHLNNWQGLYFGGQAGVGAAGVNFSGGVSSLIANILRFTTVQNEFAPSQWASLPRRADLRPMFGAFFGYNAQYNDTVLGIEFSYNHTSMRMVSGDTIGRSVNTSDGYTNDVTVSGTGTANLTDYVTIRGRAAWAYNNILPYGFVGAAVGRADITRSASVTINGYDSDPACVGPPNVCLPNYNYAQSDGGGATGKFIFGWTIGLGVDWEVFRNVFVRGEYEYVAFPNLENNVFDIHSARFGAGIKF